MSIDFDIHGLVGIRLINPSPADAAAVRRQLGPLEGTLSTTPDILVRFVRRLAVQELQYVEFGQNGFTNDAFYILRSRKESVRTRIDFREIGGPCEIVCESGIRAVPMLLAILNLTLVSKGCIPLHASAFEYNGTGVVVTGWAKGGKTEALLAFAQRGARYVGDEWVLLTADGQAAFGVPEHIRLQQWHLAQLPHVRKHLKVADRAFFTSINLFDACQRRLPESVARRSSLLRRLRNAAPALRRQLNAQFDPHLVFGNTLGPFHTTPQKLFFMVSHDRPAVEVEAADPMQIADRMCESVRYEQLPFFSSYLAYRFAFPDRPNKFIEEVHEIRRALLRRALSGKDTHVVRHPYPCSLDALFESMRPFCTPAAAGQEFRFQQSEPATCAQAPANSALRSMATSTEVSRS